MLELLNDNDIQELIIKILGQNKIHPHELENIILDKIRVILHDNIVHLVDKGVLRIDLNWKITNNINANK